MSEPAAAQAPLDTKVLRNALGSFPTGVTIITTVGPDGRPVGLTCNSFQSVSLDPPLVSWGLRLASASLEAFRQASAFTVNILAEDQAELSSRFARRDIADKFAGIGWRAGLQGTAVLDGCVASFQCEKFAEQTAGDHTLFLGKVLHFEHGGRSDSMVFYRGAYMMAAQSLSDLAEKCSMDAADLQNARRLLYGMLVREACELATEEDFAAIQANIEALEQAIAADDTEQRVNVGLQFFSLIAQAAHSEVLLAVSESLSGLLRRVLRAGGPVPRFRSELVAARRRILACLRARDMAAAEREMTDLFRETAHLERAGSGPGKPLAGAP